MLARRKRAEWRRVQRRAKGRRREEGEC